MFLNYLSCFIYNIFSNRRVKLPNVIFNKKYTLSHAKIATNITSTKPKAIYIEKKRIYEHKQSIKTNHDQNPLFSYMLELKHTYFSQATLIKPIDYKRSHRLLEFVVISKTNPIISYRILSDLTIPDEHHTTRKEYQNR